MDVVYLINDAIYFYPNDNKLVYGSREHQGLTLTQPAAKCLQLLLKTEGLVSQHSLYGYAWGEKGHNVSPNTLYQNISLIRRALKNLIPGAESWIITVPRQGFMFERSISVKTLVTEEPSENRLAEQPLPFIKIAKTKPLRTLLLVFLFGLLSIFTILIMPVNADFHKLTGDYYQIDHDGACQLYVYQNHLPLEEHIYSAIDQHIDCGSYPHIYITTNKFIKNISLLSCQRPLTGNRSSCASWSLGEST